MVRWTLRSTYLMIYGPWANSPMAALVQALIIFCLKSCNPLSPHSPHLYTPGSSLHHSYCDPPTTLSTLRLNCGIVNAWPVLVNPQHGVQASLTSHHLMFSITLKTVPCYSSNNHVFSFTCLSSGYSWNAITFFSSSNTYSSFKANLKYDLIFEPFLNSSHSPQQIESILWLLTFSTWY